MKKKNTWNIRCLVVESFVEATQHIILKIDGFLFTHGAFERNVVYERSFEGWRGTVIQALSANLAGMA